MRRAVHPYLLARSFSDVRAFHVGTLSDRKPHERLNMAASQFCRHLKVSLTLARLSSSGPQCSVTTPFDDRGSMCERTRKRAVALADALSITSLERVPGFPIARLYLHSFSIFSISKSTHQLWDITALEATPEPHLIVCYNFVAALSQLLQPWGLATLHHGIIPKVFQHS